MKNIRNISIEPIDGYPDEEDNQYFRVRTDLGNGVYSVINIALSDKEFNRYLEKIIELNSPILAY